MNYNTFQEGQSTARPPFFTGSNYIYWATRMRVFMESSGFDIWQSTQTQYVAPTTEVNTWTDAQKTNASNNSKAMNVLYCALDKNEFSRIMMCKTAYDIWHMLQITHEGTTKVKQTKISILKNQFSSFKMKPNESIIDMYSRFQTIQHDLMALGVTFTDFDLITRILNALTDEWERKVLAIEEANVLSDLKVEELIGNLMSYEANLQARKELAQEKRSIAFQVNNDDDSELEEEDVVFFAKNYNKFRKFNRMVKKQKPNSSTDTSNFKCYECDKFGHMKKDCPELHKEKKNSKKNFKNEKFFKKSKRAFQVTWDDSSSESETESDNDGEQANVCFMANSDEVHSNLSFDDMIEIASELDNKYRTLRKIHKECPAKINRLELEVDMLKEEKKILEEEILKLQNLNKTLFNSDSDNILDFKQDNERLVNDKNILKSTIVNLEDKIDVLTKDNVTLKQQTVELEKKVFDLSTNISKFNKGKENLSQLINSSKPSNNKKGLGFDKIKSKIPESKNTSLYSNFHKSGKKIQSITSKKKSYAQKFENQRSIKIWIPKSNYVLIRQKHINKFLIEVHLNKNFKFQNSTKPSWVWLPTP